MGERANLEFDNKVNEQEPQEQQSAGSIIDLGMDPTADPKFTGYIDIEADTPKDFVKIRPALKPRKNNTPLIQNTASNDEFDFDDVGNDNHKKKARNFTVITPFLPVLYSEMSGMGRLHDATSKSPEFSLVLTDKKFGTPQGIQAIGTLGEDLKKWANMRQNLKDFGHLVGEFLYFNRQIMSKRFAASLGKFKSSNNDPKFLESKEGKEALKKFLIEELSSKDAIHYPWSFNGNELTIKFSTNAFFEVNNENVEDKSDPYGKNALAKMMAPPTQQTRLKECCEYIQSKIDSKMRFTIPKIEYLEQRERVRTHIANQLPNFFFDRVPRGSLVQVVASLISTPFKDKRNFKFAIQKIFVLRYEMVKIDSLSIASAAPQGFNPGDDVDDDPKEEQYGNNEKQQQPNALPPPPSAFNNKNQSSGGNAVSQAPPPDVQGKPNFNSNSDTDTVDDNSNAKKPKMQASTDDYDDNIDFDQDVMAQLDKISGHASANFNPGK